MISIKNYFIWCTHALLLIQPFNPPTRLGMSWQILGLTLRLRPFVHPRICHDVPRLVGGVLHYRGWTISCYVDCGSFWLSVFPPPPPAAVDHPPSWQPRGTARRNPSFLPKPPPPWSMCTVHCTVRYWECFRSTLFHNLDPDFTDYLPPHPSLYCTVLYCTVPIIFLLTPHKADI